MLFFSLMFMGQRLTLKKQFVFFSQTGLNLTWLLMFNTYISIRNAFLIPLRNDTSIFDQFFSHDCQFHFLVQKKSKTEKLHILFCSFFAFLF